MESGRNSLHNAIRNATIQVNSLNNSNFILKYIIYAHSTEGDDIQAQVKKGKYDFKHECWRTISSDAKDVIKRLICVDANKRASLEEILNHKWIKKDIKMKEKALKLMYPDENAQTEMDMSKRGLDQLTGNDQPDTKKFKPSDSSDISE